MTSKKQYNTDKSNFNPTHPLTSPLKANHWNLTQASIEARFTCSLMQALSLKASVIIKVNQEQSLGIIEDLPLHQRGSKGTGWEGMGTGLPCRGGWRMGM